MAAGELRETSSVSETFGQVQVLPARKLPNTRVNLQPKSPTFSVREMLPKMILDSQFKKLNEPKLATTKCAPENPACNGMLMRREAIRRNCFGVIHPG